MKLKISESFQMRSCCMDFRTCNLFRKMGVHCTVSWDFLKFIFDRMFFLQESFDEGSLNRVNGDTSYDHNYIPQSNTNEEKRHRIEPCDAPEGSNVTSMYVPVVDAKFEASASRPTRSLSSGGTRTSATTTKGSQARYIQTLKSAGPSSNTSIGLGPAHWEEKYFKVCVFLL